VLMVLGFRVRGWSKLGSEASRDKDQPSPTSIARLVASHIQLGICVRVELHQEMDAPKAGNGGSRNGK
jgi:hypothetical protein